LLPAQLLLGVKCFDSRTARRNEALRQAMRAGSPPTPANAAMGQAGMPDALRITAEGFGAHPQHQAHARASTARRHGKVRTTFLAFSTLMPSEGAWAAGGHEFRGFEAYLSALPLLDRDDIAALALTVGILCFAMTVATLAGHFIETKGQVIGGRAILRLREVSGTKQELAELARRHQKHLDDSAAIHALIATIPTPVWARDEAGKLSFTNQAY